MTLNKFVASLTQKQQYKLAFDLINKALVIWDNYAKHNKFRHSSNN